MPRGEHEHIDWIRGRVPRDPRVLVGIGDDTAVLSPQPLPLLATTDMLLEGVHFDLSRCTPRQVGRKAMNVNLSDIAAMAGQPTAALVAVGLPSGADTLAEELFEGLHDAALGFGVALVGGDTNRSCSGLVVCVTLLGVPTGAGPVLRSGAQPGDAICVTGQLGYSLAGWHLDFVPRLPEAQRLHARYRLHSMIDLSDGLGSDLFHIVGESRCGAVLQADAIPIRPVSQGESPDGTGARSPLEHALHDGEDFELLFTLEENEAQRLVGEQPLAEFGATVSRIGRITAEAGVWIEQSGRCSPLARGGFVHQW